jgi:hypothetical protein
MRAFEVHLNGKRLCVAGVGEHGVLCTCVTYVKGPNGADLDLTVSGLFTPIDEHAIWINRRLKARDKVVVKIIEAESVDKPRKQYRPDSETAERNQKAYVRACAKKFGWQIITRPRKSK